MSPLSAVTEAGIMMLAAVALETAMLMFFAAAYATRELTRRFEANMFAGLAEGRQITNEMFVSEVEDEICGESLKTFRR